MWTLQEIGEWLQGNRESNRAAIREEVEAEYKQRHDERMQKMEDDAWDRDIEYRAQTMKRERDHEIQQRNIRNRQYIGTEMSSGLQAWMNSEPLMIEPLPRKVVYMVYDRDTCRYPDTGKIREKLMVRYRELIAESKQQ